MKHNMKAFVALLTMGTFAGAVMAQPPEKPTVPAVTDKPSVSAAEKPKTEEPKVAGPHYFNRGSVGPGLARIQFRVSQLYEKQGLTSR